VEQLLLMQGSNVGLPRTEEEAEAPWLIDDTSSVPARPRQGTSVPFARAQARQARQARQAGKSLPGSKGAGT
jgi:hypothetical protein